MAKIHIYFQCNCDNQVNPKSYIIYLLESIGFCLFATATFGRDIMSCFNLQK